MSILEILKNNHKINSTKHSRNSIAKEALVPNTQV